MQQRTITYVIIYKVYLYIYIYTYYSSRSIERNKFYLKSECVTAREVLESYDGKGK